MENRANREKVMENDEYVLDKLQQGQQFKTLLPLDLSAFYIKLVPDRLES